MELHVHLEGAIQPETLLALARGRGRHLPADDVEGLRRWFEFRDFDHFVEVYLACSACLRDPEDFQRIVADFARAQSEHNVLYTEAHFTISTHLANGANGSEVGDALGESIREAERRYGVVLRLIPDIVRNAPWKRADQTLEWALDHRDDGVVGLGLAGIESHPDEPFREHFAVAAQEGLSRVIHAGEHEGPEAIRSAIEHCGAERIAHGIRAVDDPALMEELRERKLPLDVTPMSNVRLGAVPSLKEHPLPLLLDAGLEVTLGTDDPALFDTDPSREYEAVSEAFGLGPDVLAGFARTAVDCAFLSSSERESLRARLESALTENELEVPHG